jgi:hypothetical protein
VAVVVRVSDAFDVIGVRGNVVVRPVGRVLEVAVVLEPGVIYAHVYEGGGGEIVVFDVEDGGGRGGWGGGGRRGGEG